MAVARPFVGGGTIPVAVPYVFTEVVGGAMRGVTLGSGGAGSRFSTVSRFSSFLDEEAGAGLLAGLGTLIGCAFFFRCFVRSLGLPQSLRV